MTSAHRTGLRYLLWKLRRARTRRASAARAPHLSVRAGQLTPNTPSARYIELSAVIDKTESRDALESADLAKLLG